MAAVDSAQISPALERFLDAPEDAPVEEDELQEPSGDLSLGDLDITSSQVSVKGLEEQIQQFADSDVLRAILDQGCDPREYERQYEGQLREAEQGSVQDYIAESENLVMLHDQIKSCDEILGSMEEMLGRFQGDLGNISTEIRSLQEQSQSMSVKLRNRKAAEQKLGAFLDNLAIPSGLIEGIVQGDVDESYQDYLTQLHKKLDFVEQDESARQTAAYRDVAPELERLRLKALTKVREFLMTRIYALRKPKTNIQILQQNVLLKYKYLMAFLRRHGQEVLGEVRSAYVETLARVLSSHFRAYLTAIERLQVADLQDNVGSAGDVIGDASQNAFGGVMANLFARSKDGPAPRKHSIEVFAVGNRAAILHHLDQAAIIPHVAESEGRKCPFEVLFRSVHKLLMDTSTSEYLFCTEFFQDDSVYHELMAPALGVVESSLAAQLQEMHDLVGLLLMIRINGAHQLIMNKRRVPCLDGYLDRVNLLLWPRFKVVFDAQLLSLKAFNPASFSEDVKVHGVTQRYAILTASLLLLNSDFQDNQLEHNIDRLRYAAMDLLTKLSRQFKHRRNGVIFLVNNFTHIVQLLHEAASKAAKTTPALGAAPPPQNAPLGISGAETLKSFEDQLATATSVYVEEALRQQFGALIAFVQQAEAAQTRSQAGPPQPGVRAGEAVPIVKDFTAKWSAAIETLNRDVMRDFRGSPSGREILKAAMTQLLLFYTRFLELLKRGGPELAGLAKDAVTVPSIMYEIKRYNRA